MSGLFKVVLGIFIMHARQLPFMHYKAHHTTQAGAR